MELRNPRTFHARTEPPCTICPLVTHYEEIPMPAPDPTKQRSGFSKFCSNCGMGIKGSPQTCSNCMARIAYPDPVGLRPKDTTAYNPGDTAKYPGDARNQIAGQIETPPPGYGQPINMAATCPEEAHAPTVVEGRGRADTVYSTAPLGPGASIKFQPINEDGSLTIQAYEDGSLTIQASVRLDNEAMPYPDDSRNLDGIKPGEVETDPKTGAKQSKLATFFSLPYALMSVMECMGEGAAKYETPGYVERTHQNWHGISVRSNLQHALTHLCLYFLGNTDEDHLQHFATRAMMALDQRESGRDKGVGA